MSRDTIEVRECDRCKTQVEARALDAFAGWGSATATGERDGQRTGFANADLCPDCFDFLVHWFSLVMRERDAERTCSPRPARPAGPSIKQVAAQLIADNLAQSPDLDNYLAQLDDIASLDALQEYQARNALAIMRWMADPALTPRLTEAHYAAYQRLEALSQDQEPA